MNELLPPGKTPFQFTIAGTVILSPRSARVPSATTENSENPINTGGEQVINLMLPQFGVLASDSESVQTTLAFADDAEGEGTLEVHLPSSDPHEGSSRRSVEKRGESVRCGTEGARIELKIPKRSPSSGPKAESRIPRSRTTSNSSGSKILGTNSVPFVGVRKRRRDGRLMIPFVEVEVTPLVESNRRRDKAKGKEKEKERMPSAYAVKVSLPSPCEAGTEWLEFGLPYHPASHSATSSPSASETEVEVEVVSASVYGVPVLFEQLRPAPTANMSEVSLNMANLGSTSMGSEWASWVRARVGEEGGEPVVVEYVVSLHEEEANNASKLKKGKGKELGILLPCFVLPVGKLSVTVDSATGAKVTSIRSNIPHEGGEQQILGFALEELFRPRALLRLEPSTPSSPSRRFVPSLSTILSTMMLLLTCLLLANSLGLQSHLEVIHGLLLTQPSTENQPYTRPDFWERTTTVTTIIQATPLETPTKGWFAEASAVSDAPTPQPTPSPQRDPPPTPHPSYDKTTRNDPGAASLLLWEDPNAFWKRMMRIRIEIPDIRTIFTIGALSSGFGRLMGMLGKAWNFPAAE
jgi:hypothetical protein